MCPPTYFDVEYEINPWMRTSVRVDRELALKQWDTLAETYAKLGIAVETIDPVEGLPDMVFTANAGLVVNRTVILSSFKFPQRQPEAAHFGEWFVKAGYEVVKLAEGEYFEGQGEALWCGGTLIAGYGFRANPEGLRTLKQYAGVNVLFVQLTNPKFYHLDTCFLPLGDGRAAWYPSAFSDSSREMLRGTIPQLIEVSKEDAEQFASNGVVVGERIVMPKGAAHLPSELKKLHFEVMELDMSEFKKSGGGVRCLTLDLNEGA